MVRKGLNSTHLKMANFHPKKSYISKIRLRLHNRLDGGNYIGISYRPPPLIPLWYWSSELQVGVLAILTTPLTVISLLLYRVKLSSALRSNKYRTIRRKTHAKREKLERAMHLGCYSSDFVSIVRHELWFSYILCCGDIQPNFWACA